MTTYNTGNPVPSGDARDRFDNSQTLDETINSSMPSTVTRTGKVIRTLEGMQQEFNSLIEGFGFTYAGPYVAGTVILSHLSYVEVDGLAYVLKPSVSVPYTVTGDWNTESINFNLAGDSVLRSELADGGPDLVNPSVVGATSIDTGSVSTSLRQVLDNRNAYPFQFGAVGDGVADDTIPWQKAIATGKLIDGLGKTYKVSEILEFPSNRLTIRSNFLQAGGSVDNKSVIQITGLGGTIKENIHFHDCHINGNREAQTNIGFGSSGDGERHGFYVKGQAKNILFSRCSADNCATDGLTLFGAAAGVTFAIQGVVIDQCSFRKNRRHGVAFDTLYKLRAFGGDWFNNGNDLPGASGQPITSGYYGARAGDVNGPQYGNGCDIESYGADGSHSTHVEDVEFHGVNMTGNYSGGLKILTMPGSDFNGQPGYLNPIWKPMKNIKIFGGVYDEGVNGAPSAETSPIQGGASGLLPANIVGLVDFYVYGVNCASSIALNNTKNCHFQGSIDSLNGGPFKYHAFIQNCQNVNLQLSTPQTLAVYQDSSSVTVNKPLTSVALPTVTASGGTITTQSAALVSSDLQTGQLYRINLGVTLTLAVGSVMQFDFAGRTILDVHGSFYNPSTQFIGPVFYRAAGGYALIKPDAQQAVEVIMYVTVA